MTVTGPGRAGPADRAGAAGAGLRRGGRPGPAAARRRARRSARYWPPGDEGVLIANRLAAPVPVIDQVDTAAAAACPLLAVEVRPPGQPLTMLTDPVALGAALRPRRRRGGRRGHPEPPAAGLLQRGDRAGRPRHRERGRRRAGRRAMAAHARAAASRSARRAPSWPAGRPGTRQRARHRGRRDAGGRPVRAGPGPGRRTPPPPGGAAPGGPCWSRRCTAPRPAWTTPRCSASCSAARCAA